MLWSSPSEPKSLFNTKSSSCEDTEIGDKDSHCNSIKKRKNTKLSTKKSLTRKMNKISDDFKPETNGKMNTGLNKNSSWRTEEMTYEPISRKPGVYKKINEVSSDTYELDNVKYGKPKGKGRNILQTQAKPN